MAGAPLDFEQITKVLRGTRGNIATASTIATRLERGLTLVQRALDRMVAEGALDLVPTFRGDQYRLVEGIVAQGGVTPYETKGMPREMPDSAEPDADMASDEAIAADRLWRQRLGQRRWTDDPRALRERHRQDHIIPPFYRMAAREI